MKKGIVRIFKDVKRTECVEYYAIQYKSFEEMENYFNMARLIHPDGYVVFTLQGGFEYTISETFNETKNK